MSLILIACTPEASISLKRILNEHDLTVVETMTAALAELRNQTFDLIIVGLHFDGSKMYEFMREVKDSSSNKDKPIICYCARDTEMTRIMHESLQQITRFLGAWMYLDQHAYNVYKNPDEELRRVIERCLTAEARKHIQKERVDIQKQRTHLQSLREMLQSEEWSPELKAFLQQLKCDLEVLLHKAIELQAFADGQRLKVESSRDLKDRVSEHVTIDENGMTQQERIQSLSEASQLTNEEALEVKESILEKEGLSKLSEHVADEQEQFKSQ